jgi:hypothetical protein
MMKLIAILLLSTIGALAQPIFPPSQDTNYFLYSPFLEGQGSVISDWKAGHIGIFNNSSWLSGGVLSLNSNGPSFGHDPFIVYAGTNWADNPTNLTAAIWYKYTGTAAPAWWAYLLGKCGNTTNPVETGEGWWINVNGADAGAKNVGLAGAVLQNANGAAWLQNVSNTRVTDGSWHWICCTWTGGAGGATSDSVYVDGIKGSSNYNQGTYKAGVANTASVQIGAAEAGDATGNEDVAQAVILTWALSASQVTTLYRSATGVSGNIPSVNWGLVAP